MKIGVVGCAGRMGSMVVRQVAATVDCVLVGGTEHETSEVLGQDIGEVVGLRPLGIPVTNDSSELFERAEGVIDFTLPETTCYHASLSSLYGTSLIVGTTGLQHNHLQALKVAAQKVPIVQSANMSLGINVLLGIIEQVSRTLTTDFDVEILEMHHRQKRDVPSGTALAFGQAVATGRGVALEDVRTLHTGPRPPHSIGFATLRGGDVIGEHSIIFAGGGERIEFSHKSSGRHVFAIGAVTAAIWTKNRPPGLYTMRDVLNV